jgi:hypothetical protein
VIGFIGVLFASDPFGVRASFPALLVLIAAAFWGYGIILMRQIARMEPTLLQMLAINTVFLITTGIACLFHWQPVTMPQLALLIGVGLIGGLAQFLVFEAARMIPCAAVWPAPSPGTIPAHDRATDRAAGATGCSSPPSSGQAHPPQSPCICGCEILAVPA